MQAKPLFKGLEAHITIKDDGSAFVGKAGADYKLTLDEYLLSTRGFKPKLLFVLNKGSEQANNDRVHEHLKETFAKYGYNIDDVMFKSDDTDLRRNVKSNEPDFEKLFPIKSGQVVVNFPATFK